MPGGFKPSIHLRPYTTESKSVTRVNDPIIERKKAAWEVAGNAGISAAAVTTNTMNKLNGSIVAATGKKIVFD